MLYYSKVLSKYEGRERLYNRQRRKIKSLMLFFNLTKTSLRQNINSHTDLLVYDSFLCKENECFALKS